VSGASTCPVTNNDTDLTLAVESTYVDLQTGSETSKAFINGTTPIITVFYATPDQADAPVFLAEPEIHLSCLRGIFSDEQQKQINAGNRQAMSPMGATYATIFVVTVALMSL